MAKVKSIWKSFIKWFNEEFPKSKHIDVWGDYTGTNKPPFKYKNTKNNELERF